MRLAPDPRQEEQQLTCAQCRPCGPSLLLLVMNVSLQQIFLLGDSLEGPENPWGLILRTIPLDWGFSTLALVAHGWLSRAWQDAQQHLCPLPTRCQSPCPTQVVKTKNTFRYCQLTLGTRSPLAFVDDICLLL